MFNKNLAQFASFAFAWGDWCVNKYLPRQEKSNTERGDKDDIYFLVFQSLL